MTIHVYVGTMTHWYIVCFYMLPTEDFHENPRWCGMALHQMFFTHLPQKVSVWKNRARSPWFIVRLSTQMSIHSCRALSTSKTQPCRWSEAGHECRLPSPCDRLIGFDHLTVCVGRWRPVSAPADVTWATKPSRWDQMGMGSRFWMRLRHDETRWDHSIYC